MCDRAAVSTILVGSLPQGKPPGTGVVNSDKSPFLFGHRRGTESPATPRRPSKLSRCVHGPRDRSSAPSDPPRIGHMLISRPLPLAQRSVSSRQAKASRF